MVSANLRLFRRRLRAADLAPKSAFARITLYLFGVDLLLVIIQKIVQLFGGKGDSFSGWISFLTIVFSICAILQLFRWASRRLLWRLRNRLLVTYVFIGVIPLFLVVLMFGITSYLFTGQFATYSATSAIEAHVDDLRAANSQVAKEVAAQLANSSNPSRIAALEAVRARFPNAEIAAWYGERPLEILSPDASQAPSFTPPPAPRKGGATKDHAEKLAGDVHRLPGLVLDHDRTYLRVVSRESVNGGPLVVVSSVPVDQAFLEHIATGLGEVGFYELPGIVVTDEGQSTVTVRNPASPAAAGSPGLKPIAAAGGIPDARGRWDRLISYGIIVRSFDWSTGKLLAPVLRVQTRLSALYERLFSNLGELADIAIYLLVAIAFVFALIELIALIIGLGLTRTITRSVAKLYVATQHINRGDLKHRITVKSNDQLAALETSFNSMAESLERLLAEQREKERLQNELAIAQEVQAQLFPRQELKFDSLELHGVCRPARVVSGDYYDFLPLGHDKLALAVGDISGKGISAALLMATIHSAVRAYEFGRMPVPEEMMTVGAAAVAAARAGCDPEPMVAGSAAVESPAAVLYLLNRHLYHSTPAEKYATLFLGLYDGSTRTMTYANGGHLPPILIGEDGSVRRLGRGGLVIGLFDNITHEEDTIGLRPGDIFLAYSDGVTEPENEFGEFGEQRLIQTVLENRHLPLARISEEVLSAVQGWIGAAEQPDDVTLVLARAR